MIIKDIYHYLTLATIARTVDREDGSVDCEKGSVDY